jgi:hypothetical protein
LSPFNAKNNCPFFKDRVSVDTPELFRNKLCSNLISINEKTPN